MLKTLGRLLQVIFAFFISFCIAIILLTFLGGRELATLYIQDIQSANPQAIDPAVSLFYEVLASIQFFSNLNPALALGPALLAIIVGEIARIKSMLYYVIAGGLAILAMIFLFEPTNTETIVIPSAKFMTVFAATGFVAGFVYWLLAGRTTS